MIYRKTLMMIIYVSLLLNTAYANTSNTLFTYDTTVMSSNQAAIPLAGSSKEWNIVLQKNLVAASSDQFVMHMPELSQANAPFSVIRTSYRAYQNGNTQWVGDIYAASQNPSGRAGYIIVNIIDGNPFAVIKLNNQSYEIYTDPLVGSRLAQIEAGNPLIKDDQHSGQFAAAAVSNSAPWLFNSNIPGTSVVDVLVLIDDDLDFVGSSIFDKIDAEVMNANMILAESGPNGVGVPLRLNVLPIESIDIPNHLERVSCPYPFINFSCESPEFAELTNGISSTSQALINKRNQANADIVVLYVPFDPVPLDPDVSTTYDVCGFADKPFSTADDNIFSKSFSLHASSCNLGQFVFLHEILHSFGSAHPGDPAFTPYAKGIDIAATATTTSMATLMGCQYNGDPTDPFDPGATDCDRLKHLSTPLVDVEGQTIGNAVNADNVRFLTECTANACRRDQLAKRKNGTNPVDLIPTVSIVTPADFVTLQPTNALLLTAQAADDIGVNSVTWEVTKNGSIVASGTGVGVDYSFNTSAFTASGEYLVSATVEDSIGQIAIDTNTVYVDAFPAASISTPFDGEIITAVESYALTVQASDDMGIVNVNWTVRDQNNQVVSAGTGAGNDYEFLTSAFAIVGNYVVTVSVEDTIGQVSTDTVAVVVEPDPSKNVNIVPITYLIITQ